MEYLFLAIGFIIGALVMFLVFYYRNCLASKEIKIKSSSGSVEREYTIKNGVKEGQEIFYLSNGNKLTRVWNNGILEGDAIETSSDGTIVMKDTYSKDLLVKHILFSYYDGGKIKSELMLEGNNGIEKIYYSTGELNKEKNIANFVAEGKATTYYKDGSIYIVDFYKDGALYKKSEVFDERGNTINF